MSVLRIVAGSIRNIFTVAKENERLRRQVAGLQSDLVRMQRSRDYWAAYQRQTAAEAGRAQDIMVRKIGELSQKAGVPLEDKWAESLETWDSRRVKSEDSHPFSATFSDLGKDVTPTFDPSDK